MYFLFLTEYYTECQSTKLPVNHSKYENYLFTRESQNGADFWCRLIDILTVEKYEMRVFYPGVSN